MTQIRASQIRASQIRATEISSNHRKLHGAFFLCADCFAKRTKVKDLDSRTVWLLTARFETRSASMCGDQEADSSVGKKRISICNRTSDSPSASSPAQIQMIQMIQTETDMSGRDIAKSSNLFFEPRKSNLEFTLTSTARVGCDLDQARHCETFCLD